MSDGRVRTASGGDLSNICMIILAILIPPLAVFIKGGCSVHFWINILLCFLGYIPGLVHAIWYVFANKD
uniref:Plasma membrane proteolipid 3 n=1 Tax=Parastrongyloides trichosuri TaxID=131310 RepID=A0A0N4Z3K1_PARTI